MTEHDYIIATDVRTIMIVEDALRHVIPANNPHVAAGEYIKVMLFLNKWRMAMYAEINAEDNTDE